MLTEAADRDAHLERLDGQHHGDQVRVDALRHLIEIAAHPGCRHSTDDCVAVVVPHLPDARRQNYLEALSALANLGERRIIHRDVVTRRDQLIGQMVADDRSLRVSEIGPSAAAAREAARAVNGRFGSCNSPEAALQLGEVDPVRPLEEQDCIDCGKPLGFEARPSIKGYGLNCTDECDDEADGVADDGDPSTSWSRRIAALSRIFTPVNRDGDTLGRASQRSAARAWAVRGAFPNIPENTDKGDGYDIHDYMMEAKYADPSQLPKIWQDAVRHQARMEQHPAANDGDQVRANCLGWVIFIAGHSESVHSTDDCVAAVVPRLSDDVRAQYLDRLLDNEKRMATREGRAEALDRSDQLITRMVAEDRNLR